MIGWRLLPLLLPFVVTTASAVELSGGAEAEGGWNSNAVNTPNGPSSWTGKVGPFIHVDEPQGDLQFDLLYRARYDTYYDLHALDGWEHYANLTGSYRFSGTTTVRFGNLFQFYPVGSSQYQNLAAINGQPVPGQVLTVLGTNRVLLNNASVTLSHAFSPLWLTELELSNSYYDPRGEVGAVSSDTTVGQGSMIYQLDEVDQLGAGVGVTAQQFLATNNRGSTHTEYYNVFGLWRHDFSPTLKLDAQAGPTLVDASPQKVTAQTIGAPQIALTSDGSGAFFSSCPPSASGLHFFQDCTDFFRIQGQVNTIVDIPLIADQWNGRHRFHVFRRTSRSRRSGRRSRAG